MCEGNQFALLIGRMIWDNPPQCYLYPLIRFNLLSRDSPSGNGVELSYNQPSLHTPITSLPYFTKSPRLECGQRMTPATMAQLWLAQLHNHLGTEPSFIDSTTSFHLLMAIVYTQLVFFF